MTGTLIQPTIIKDILTGILLCLLIIAAMHIMPLIGIFAFHYWINAGVVWRSLREEAKLLFNAKLLAELRAENLAVKEQIAELGDE